MEECPRRGGRPCPTHGAALQEKEGAARGSADRCARKAAEAKADFHLSSIPAGILYLSTDRKVFWWLIGRCKPNFIPLSPFTQVQEDCKEETGP